MWSEGRAIRAEATACAKARRWDRTCYDGGCGGQATWDLMGFGEGVREMGSEPFFTAPWLPWTGALRGQQETPAASPGS